MSFMIEKLEGLGNKMIFKIILAFTISKEEQLNIIKKIEKY